MKRKTSSAPDHEAINKSSWGPGPWQHEPDRVEFLHRDVPCLLVRHPRLGHWCGYVGVEPGHPWHAVDRDDVPACNSSVHGEVTWAGPSEGLIRSMADPQRFDAYWWVGFDCAHADDLVPQIEGLFAGERPAYGVYRDLAYVRARTIELAEQVIAARAVSPNDGV